MVANPTQEKLLEKLNKLLHKLFGPGSTQPERDEALAAILRFQDTHRVDLRDFNIMPTKKMVEGRANGEIPIGMTSDGFFWFGKKICPRIDVQSKERHRNTKTGKHVWSRTLHFQDSEGNPQTFQLPEDRKADFRWLPKQLALHGLDILLGKDFEEAHEELCKWVQKEKPSKVSYYANRIGWYTIPGTKHNVFVLPERILGDTRDQCVYQPVSQPAPHASQGTFKEWQENVASFAALHHKAAFAMSVSFVGPLLTNLRVVESGGFHFMGESSRGKTAITEGAMSVWGNPRKGMQGTFLKDWDFSEAGLAGAAMAHNHTMLVFDEIGQAKDPKAIGRIVYSLIGGSSGTRATSSGHMRDPMNWMLFALSTGEKTVQDAIKEAGGKRRPMGGQQVRFPDIPVIDTKLGILDALAPMTRAEQGLDENAQAGQIVKRFQEASYNTYGTAGPLFVERLMTRGMDKTVPEVRKMISQFESECIPVGSDPQIRRVATRFGTVAACGELAISLGILPWKKGYAYESASRMFARWLSYRESGTENAERFQYIKQIKNMLLATGDSSGFYTVARVQSGRGKTAPYKMVNPDAKSSKRLGFRVIDAKTKELQQFLILPSVFEDTYCASFNKRVMSRALIESGVVVADKEGKYSTLTRISPYFHDRVVVVDWQKLQEFDVTGEGAWEPQNEAKAKPGLPRLPSPRRKAKKATRRTTKATKPAARTTKRARKRAR